MFDQEQLESNQHLKTLEVPILSHYTILFDLSESQSGLEPDMKEVAVLQ